jgi:Secretion system C-terminal sorting domain
MKKLIIFIILYFALFFSNKIMAQLTSNTFDTEMIELTLADVLHTKPKPAPKKASAVGQPKQKANPLPNLVPSKINLNGIKSFCIDKDDNKYILTHYDTVIGGIVYSSDRIMKVLKQGIVTHFAGSANPFAPLQDSMPAKRARLVANKIKVDKKGNVYALSTNSVHIIDSRSFIRTLPVSLNNATDFAIDSFGKVFVVDDTLVKAFDPGTNIIRTIIGGGSGVRNFITCGLNTVPANAIENAKTSIVIGKKNALFLVNQLSIRAYSNDTIYPVLIDTIKKDLDMFDWNSTASVGGGFTVTVLTGSTSDDIGMTIYNAYNYKGTTPTPVILQFYLDSLKIHPFAGSGKNGNYNDSTLITTKFERISGAGFDNNGSFFVADDSLSFVVAGYDTANNNAALNSILNTASITNQCTKIFPFTWKGIAINSGGFYENAAGKNKNGYDSTVLLQVNDTRTTGATIAGATSMCVGMNTTYTTNISDGVWTTTTGRASIDAITGVATGSNPGVTNVSYTIADYNGCVVKTEYPITVKSIPAVPSIAYAAGSINPQIGAGRGNFCNNKNFNVVGSPSGGDWSSSNTALLTVSSTGAVSTIGTGTVSLTYRVSNGTCTNARSISGTIISCGSRSINSEILTNNDLQWTLFPNPANSKIHIQIEKLIGTGSIIVTDLYGKQIKMQPLSMGLNTLDLSSCSKGFYLITVATNEGTTTKKLIIE